MEVIPCPCCQGALSVMGRRKRIRKQADGMTCWLILRRLRCQQCHTIHHELPDCLVPYKRYDAESLERGVTEGATAAVAAEEATWRRWRHWFAVWSVYAAHCLAALTHRIGWRVQAASQPFPPILRRLGPLVGDAPGWLSRAVRPLVNAHLWIVTRSASWAAP